jgi:hypothetical protein
MKKILMILAAAALLLTGCTRHYIVVIQGDSNVIYVQAEVPKKIDTSAHGELDVTP